MVQSFAKDGCLPLPHLIGSVSSTLETPVWAALLNLFFLTIFGLLLFGSSLAVQGVQSASVVMLQSSYIPAILAHIFYGRKTVLSSRLKPFLSFGEVFGPILNVAAIVYIFITTVFFLFPSVYPVKNASMMNYSVVVLAISLSLAATNWFLYARQHFRGPLNVENIQ